MHTYKRDDMSVLGVVLVLSLSVLASAEYSVVDYGARPDGRTDSARAFLAAWAAACNDTGGCPVMRVPAGRFLVDQAYFKGPCRSAGVVLAIDGTVLAPPALDNTSWIMFHYADGLAIRGGTLDGQGQAYWACKTAGRRCPPGATVSRSITYRRSLGLHCMITLRLIKIVAAMQTLDISQSKNVTVKRLTLLNSKDKHMSIYGSTGVTLQGVKIVAPADSPNTDGIHIQLSSHVNILSATVRTGDDCVSMGPGTSDVLIRNIKCGPGHGIRSQKTSKFT